MKYPGPLVLAALAMLWSAAPAPPATAQLREDPVADVRERIERLKQRRLPPEERFRDRNLDRGQNFRDRQSQREAYSAEREGRLLDRLNERRDVLQGDPNDLDARRDDRREDRVDRRLRERLRDAYRSDAPPPLPPPAPR
jgi:hypothetical protein